MGEALKRMKDPELEKTVQFVLMFDKLFGCLNVSNLDAGKHSRNPFKFPYHSAKDFRVKVSSIQVTGVDNEVRAVGYIYRLSAH